MKVLISVLFLIVSVSSSFSESSLRRELLLPPGAVIIGIDYSGFQVMIPIEEDYPIKGAITVFAVNDGKTINFVTVIPPKMIMGKRMVLVDIDDACRHLYGKKSKENAIKCILSSKWFLSGEKI
ncbi:MAG: hypothetical protein WC415_06505 [Patescibacteria group bacterium]